MKSIRSKLLLTFIFLITSLVGIGLLINIFFLESFYIHQKTIILKQSSQELKQIYKEKRKKDLATYVDTLEKSHGFSVEVISLKGVTLYSTLKGDNKGKLASLYTNKNSGQQPNVSKSGMDHLKNELSKSSYYVAETNLKSIDLEFLLVASKLDNQKIVILRTPISAIRESISIYNYFLVYIGIALLCVGAIIGLIMARSFTKPILKINTMAKEMTKLSFSNKWTGNRKDELGQLGHSMNELSTILSDFIKKISIKNQSLIDQLEEKVMFEKKRRTFISNVSHELKTPITIIQSYTEGLQVGVNQTEQEKQEYLDIIMDESNKMEQMVYDLLKLSQIQNGKVELFLEEVDLNQLVNEIIKLYSPKFVENQIQFIYEENDRLVPIQTDRLKVQQILNNYLNNAIYHVDELKLIRITISDLAEIYKVSVFNSGNHIPDDELDVIWESFYRADAARNREKGNVGLGLSIVKELSQLLNGHVGVDNEENGVNFWVELPKKI